jgi:hypothetical protein
MKLNLKILDDDVDGLDEVDEAKPLITSTP